MRRKVTNRNIPHEDIVYGSTKVEKLINYVMERGKKNVARSIVYGAFDILKEKKKELEPLEVFELAIKNTGPLMEIRSRRVGGANYQVPLPVRGERQDALAFRWIIGAARAKKGQPMHEKLATVLVDASTGVGDAVKKRDDVHRMADANKAFAHFARFAK